MFSRERSEDPALSFTVAVREQCESSAESKHACPWGGCHAPPLADWRNWGWTTKAHTPRDPYTLLYRTACVLDRPAAAAAAAARPFCYATKAESGRRIDHKTKTEELSLGLNFLSP